MSSDSLKTYLNDHLAGSVAALELLDHLAALHRGTEREQIFLGLRTEVEEDQSVLQQLLAGAGGKESPVRKAAAWLAEKLGRAKLLLDDPGTGGLHLLEALRGGAPPGGADGPGTITMLAQPLEGWVLFDGACGICSRWVPRWGPTLERMGLAVTPLQSPWVQERIGLAPEQLLNDLRLLRPDGTLISGADVYRYVMRRIWWAYPLYLLSEAPGLRRIFDWGYRTFARHRMRISASCGLPQ